MKNVVLGIIACGTVIAVLGVGGYTIGYNTAKGAVKSVTTKKVADPALCKTEKETALDVCIAAAEESYVTRWNANCSTAGVVEAAVNGKKCLLPQEKVAYYDKIRNQDRTFCLRRFDK